MHHIVQTFNAFISSDRFDSRLHSFGTGTPRICSILIHFTFLGFAFVSGRTDSKSLDEFDDGSGCYVVLSNRGIQVIKANVMRE